MTYFSNYGMWSRRSRWLVASALLLLPLIIYSNTLFARFGFRDDYAILREVHEEPGKVIRHVGTFARPLYGVMLQVFFERVDGIDDLWKGRVASALCVGAVSAMLFLALLKLSWPAWTSALLGALMSVLPAAQVIVSWAICWPHLVGGLCSFAAFLVSQKGGVLRTAAAVSLLVTGILIYQSHVFFYFVLVAAGLATYQDKSLGWRIRCLIKHFLTMGAALAASYGIMQVLYAADVFKQSSLVVLENEPLAKLHWFIAGPLRNALALIVLNDAEKGMAIAFIATAGITGGVILVGGWDKWKTGGWREGLFWAVTLSALLMGAFTANLVSMQRWSTYRTIYALTGVLLVFFVLGLQALASRLPKRREWLAPAVLGLIFLVGLPLARVQAYTLFALPQQEELALVEEGAKKLALLERATVFIIRPTIDDTCAPQRYSDEFGTLSTDSDWAPKEMLKILLNGRVPDLSKRFTVICGRSLPAGRTFTVVIDMRRLKQLRPKLENAF
ncbi:MAG: hypothetical protein HGA74_05590 [Deltaproteobacteria bacterium]|nr:hypothetical protein [Deltaproteobacteria bacterium]